MNKEIKIILEEYINDVNRVCNQLLEGLNQQKNPNLKTKSDLFEYRLITHAMEFHFKDIDYQFHGKGCFAFGKDFFLNWDFGYRNRWCGIDPWKVEMTLRENKSKYAEFYHGKLLKEACEQAVDQGEMFCKYGLYYFTIPEKETFSPAFPKEYDTLMIEYFDNQWMIARNKIIDRFIRKSNKIANLIFSYENIYRLCFLLNHKEVYSIPYEDTCYPENAVKIMSDIILKMVNAKNELHDRN